MIIIIILDLCIPFCILLSRWLPELHELVKDLGDKLANKQKPRKPKPATGNVQ